jgi:hypothetical protein
MEYAQGILAGPASEHADWPDTSAGEKIRLVAAVDFDPCLYPPVDLIQ